MIINSLIILDYKEKTSTRVEFGEKQNLIIGESNGVGKSSIIKSLYYALGSKNEDSFPKGWSFKSMKFKVNYTFDTKKGSIIRFNDLYYVDGLKKPLKNKEYSLWLQKKINIDYKLSLKNKELETARIGALLSPFYIDQDLSWGDKLYKNGSLDMYSNIPIEKIFKEFLGLSNNTLNKLKSRKQKLTQEIVKSSNKIDILSELLDEEKLEISPEPSISIEKKEDYLDLLNTINENITEFRKVKLKIFEKRNKKEIELNDLQDIKKKLESSVRDLDKKCIYCGSSVSIKKLTKRFKVLNSIDDIKYQIDYLVIDINEENKKIESSNHKELKLIKDYNDYKFILSKDRELKELKDYLEQQSQYLVANNIVKRRRIISEDVISKKNIIKDINKEIKKNEKLLEERKDQIENYYCELFNEIKNKLPKTKFFDVTDKNFLNFSKIKSSGTDSNIKKYLIYLLYFNLLDKYSKIRMPSVIDSFIFTEITKENLADMFNVISNYFLSLKNSQVFFTIVDDNLKYLGNLNTYNKINIKKDDRVLKKSNYSRDKMEFSYLD